MNQGNNIVFTEQILMTTSSSLRGNVAKLRNLLDDATVNIDRTKSFWEGPAAESLRAKYNALKTKFEPFCNFVEGAAEFLDNSAMEQATSEKKIDQAAADLPGMNL